MRFIVELWSVLMSFGHFGQNWQNGPKSPHGGPFLTVLWHEMAQALGTKPNLEIFSVKHLPRQIFPKLTFWNLVKTAFLDKNRQNRRPYCEICDAKPPDSKTSCWARDFTLPARRAKNHRKIPRLPSRHNTRLAQILRDRCNVVSRHAALRTTCKFAQNVLYCANFVQKSFWQICQNDKNCHFWQFSKWQKWHFVQKCHFWPELSKNNRFSAAGTKPVKNLPSKANFGAAGAREASVRVIFSKF